MSSITYTLDQKYEKQSYIGQDSIPISHTHTIIMYMCSAPAPPLSPPSADTLSFPDFLVCGIDLYGFSILTARIMHSLMIN